ncbi:high-affinity nicotinic acid transporter [Apiospora arundinis]|uniref:High-affinity nicotinic acid transporter n=1 Tax=Apiospora arundinis TaxID=335852 RepID=A0ABR2IG45_9PEZI
MAVHDDAAISGGSKTPSESKGEIEVGMIENTTTATGGGNSYNNGAHFDQGATRRLIRKIDWTLIPFLALLYLLSFLDRTNIGNARLAGLEKSLGMNPLGLDYNIALSVFFPWYVAAEIPSNLAMKRFRPSVWIPSIMVAWAICCTLMGLVHNYAGLLACRMALGVAEGGLFPGITYYITLWYRRHECGLRMAIFFSAATAAGAFGGLLARGIVELDGRANLGGWAWIFIIEGIITMIVAIAAFFIMNDYPDTAKFLTATEKQEVMRRLEEDRSSLADEFHLKYFWDAMKDWKIWVHMFITIGIYTPLYSFSLFLPTIISSLGFTNDKTAQLMTVPPYIAACICCIGGGYLADRHGQRGVYMIFFNCVAIFGFILQIASSNNALKYAGTFFAAMGIYPNVPQGVAWNGNNIGGSTKRGVGIAMHVGFGNLGGVIAGFLYRAKDKPMYYPGHGTLIATETMSLVLCVFMTLYLRRENARRDREHKAPSEYTTEERLLERESGDNASYFRYTI